MKKVSIVQDGRPVSRRGVLGLGFVGTMGLPAIGRAAQEPPELSPPLEARVVDCVVWAMCDEEALFNEVKGGNFGRIEKHYHLSRAAKLLLQTICEDDAGAGAITTLRQVLTNEPALAARKTLGRFFDTTEYKRPCDIFPCPWW